MKYEATFSTGDKITRTSEREYNFSWACIRNSDNKVVETGFSATRKAAPLHMKVSNWGRSSDRYMERKRKLQNYRVEFVCLK